MRQIAQNTQYAQVVTPTSDGNSVDVQYERSNANLDTWSDEHGSPAIVVATGFIAKNPLVRPETCAAPAATSAAYALCCPQKPWLPGHGDVAYF